MPGWEPGAISGSISTAETAAGVCGGYREASVSWTVPAPGSSEPSHHESALSITVERCGRCWADRPGYGCTRNLTLLLHAELHEPCEVPYADWFWPPVSSSRGARDNRPCRH